MAEYDIPANLNFIKAKTGAEKIIYMAHSQGTSQFFFAHSLYPDLHKSYKAFVGISPVLYTGGIHSAFVDTLDIL